MDFHMQGMPPEAIQRLLEEMPNLAIEASGLVGVVAIAQVVEAEGVQVEVLSVEVREAGALIHWRCRAGRPVGFLVPRVAVSDDRGTAYRVASASGGGDAQSWAGEIALTPAPPADVSLSVTFESFGADPGMAMPGWTPPHPVEGTWQFSLSTRVIRRR